MKYTILFAALFLSFGAAHAAQDNEYYTIRSMQVHEIKDATPLFAAGDQVGIGAVDCQVSGTTPLDGVGDVLDPIGQIDMIVDKIINIGKKIWTVVQAGKPVSNIKTDVATALPQGARCWTDLQNWQMPQSKNYEVVFSNGFGAEVVKFSYKVLWLPGGKANGVGSYIGYASMMPINAKVAWGFSFNAQVSIPTVFNMGSKDAPVAGMQMQMQYRVESPVVTIDQGQAFFVDGLGNFKML